MATTLYLRQGRVKRWWMSYTQIAAWDTAGLTLITLPSDFNSSNNQVEAVGGGAGGGGATGNGQGGGAYATKTNVNLGTGGQTCTVQIGNGLDTFIKDQSATTQVLAKAASGSTGGAAASCTPTTGAFSGGNGAAGGGTSAGGGGGGGAAGPNGAGGNGGSPSADVGGSGGAADGGFGSPGAEWTYTRLNGTVSSGTIGCGNGTGGSNGDLVNPTGPGGAAGGLRGGGAGGGGTGTSDATGTQGPARRGLLVISYTPAGTAETRPGAEAVQLGSGVTEHGALGGRGSQFEVIGLLTWDGRRAA